MRIIYTDAGTNGDLWWLAPDGKTQETNETFSRVDTYGDWGTHQNGQVYCLLLQTAMSVMPSKLCKSCLLHRLLFDVPSGIEFELGRAHAVFRRIHRIITLGPCIDDDDEGLGDDVPTMLEVADEASEDGRGGENDAFCVTF